jgi:hypothetical protein
LKNGKDILNPNPSVVHKEYFSLYRNTMSRCNTNANERSGNVFEDYKNFRKSSNIGTPNPTTRPNQMYISTENSKSYQTMAGSINYQTPTPSRSPSKKLMVTNNEIHRDNSRSRPDVGEHEKRTRLAKKELKIMGGLGKLENSLRSSDIIGAEINKGHLVGNRKLTSLIGTDNVNPNSDYIQKISADYVKRIDEKAALNSKMSISDYGRRHGLEQTQNVSKSRSAKREGSRTYNSIIEKADKRLAMLKTEYREKADDESRSKSRYSKDIILNPDVKKFHSTISSIGEGSKSQTRGKYNQLQ